MIAASMSIPPPGVWATSSSPPPFVPEVVVADMCAAVRTARYWEEELLAEDRDTWWDEGDGTRPLRTAAAAAVAAPLPSSGVTCLNAELRPLAIAVLP